MTDALTPAQALDYLRTLSADIVDAAVFGADVLIHLEPQDAVRPGAELTVGDTARHP